MTNWKPEVGVPAKTRSGKRADIETIKGPMTVSEKKISGRITGDGPLTWYSDGKHCNDMEACPFDLVGPWEEPKPEPQMIGTKVTTELTINHGSYDGLNVIRTPLGTKYVAMPSLLLSADSVTQLRNIAERLRDLAEALENGAK